MTSPNVILISIDTLRADHLSCYGYPRNTTPNLDRLAERGLLFKNAYSTAVWTPPAHASMLTGLYPSQHGVVDQNRLSGTVPTLAEMLNIEGYQTAGFVNNSQVGKLVSLDRGHEDFYEVWKGFEKNQVVQRGLYKVREKAGYSDHGAARTNRLVLDWFAQKRERQRPFYLFIHYIDAHNPLKAPRPFRFRYLTGELRQKVDMEKIWQIAHNPLVCLTDRLELTEAEIAALTALYDEEIAYLDYKIGELLDWLTTEGLLQETLLIVTADHGEHLGEHGLYSHVASLYEPIVHIPLIIHFPAANRPAAAIETPAQLVDIVPTVLGAVEAQHPDSPLRTGINLLAPEPQLSEERLILAEWEGRVPYFIQRRSESRGSLSVPEFISRPQRMIRRGRYKLITRSPGPDELYDIEQDPRETKNIVQQEVDLAKSLKEALENHFAAIRRDRADVEYDISDEVLKNLRDLGYL